MSGAVEICKRYAEMSSKREAADRAAGNEEGAAFESGSTITAMNLADQIARATTPCAAAEGAGKLPCPFCGKAPWIETEKASFAVMCVNAHCGESMSRWFATEAEAIAAWNVRAPITTPPARTYAEGVEDLQVLRAAVKNLLPIGNDQLAGDRVIPIYVRMDELRALHALATSRSQHEGADNA